ncbi:PQQ-like beta-propeller repeat protein [Thermoleophilia bacterium SCSIO 60948]|nr:PQQ-like beta-propeller repeat protein [Thermoleophilia bacterium SCSIO 60948]
MKRIAQTWNGWSVRRRLLTVGAFVLVCAGAAAAALIILGRESDEGCEPNCPELREEPKKKPKPEAKTVNWPEYGYDDARTRYLATDKVDPPFGSSEWSLNLGKLLEFSPIIYQDELFLMDKDATFYAVNVDNGKVEWKRDMGALNASSPSGGGGLLYGVTLEPGTAFALDARTGKKVWERDLPGRSETSPLVHGSKVYVGSESGDVFALNRKTGAIKWQRSTAGAVKGGLAFSEGKVYGGNYSGEVFAFDAGSGQTVWQTGTQGSSFGRSGPIYSTPAVAFGRVFLGSIDGRVYSFDADDGSLVWSQSTGAEVYPGPAVADPPGGPPTVYIGSADQNFYALDAETGDVRWTKDVGGPVIGAASVVGRTVYVGVIGENIGTLGYDADNGKQTFEIDEGEYNPVISDGEKLYLTGYNVIRAFKERLPTKQRQAKYRREQEREKEQRAAQRERQAERAGSGGGSGGGKRAKQGPASDSPGAERR